MSPGTNPQVDLNLLEQTRRHINRLVEEIARLSESDLPPTEYYGEFLQRVLQAVAAPAGAVWIRTPQGHLQVQYQVNLREVGLDRNETDRQAHDELLRMAFQTGRQLLVPPRSGVGPSEDGKPAPGNPTDFVILIAPIVVDKQVAGLVEIWQDPNRNPEAQQGFLQFVGRMAELASSYQRNNQLRTMVGQQALWTQLEAFARQIHGSLNPMEVAYVVANEGRRLVDCDRVSVALRKPIPFYARRKSKRKVRAQVEAISGADVVEKRSNLVRLMARLMDRVLAWGEKLVYRGAKDDSLPPDVLDALDAYLAESNSKLLVILPLKDERENESKKPPRSALMMECFDPQLAPDQLIARLEVVGRHATSALYNAAEYRRIPMRWMWQPLAKVQEGLGGKARAIIFGILAALVVLAVTMVFVPYPLKMDAKGQLLPKDRQYVYSVVDGQIKEFRVEPGQDVQKGDPLAVMHDVNLQQQINTLQGEITAASIDITSLTSQLQAGNLRPDERANLTSQLSTKKATERLKTDELNQLRKRTNSGVEPGTFTVVAPVTGTVLNGTFREELTNRTVKPNEPILRVGNKRGEWEVEMKIPQKHIGQVLQAYPDNNPEAELDVDLILRSTPTRTYRGKLMRKNIGGEAVPNRDDNNEAEPVVVAYVRISGDDIPADMRIPLSDNFLVTGTEVVAKVRCGNHPMGYSLFYGVWEFFYEKVVFFF